ILFHPSRSVLLRTGTTKRGFDGIHLRLSVPFAMPRPLVSALAFPFLFPIALLQLIWFLRRHCIQVVNLHYALDHFVYFAICRRILPIRLVTSLHGADAFVAGTPKARYSRALNYMLRRSDLIVLPSKTYLDRFVCSSPWLANKTVFIHNGVKVEDFELPAS